MKKIILLISAAIAACALSACEFSCAKDSKGYSYEQLNSMLNANYSQIVISVNNTFTDENITLESEYKVKYTQSEITVDYKVERFSSISLDSPASDVKTVYEGRAVIVGNVISGGEEVGLTKDIAQLNLTFNEDYFRNISFDKTSISADVTNPGAFLGTSLSCTDMHVEGKFNGVFESITITYKQSANEIEYRYIFT